MLIQSTEVLPDEGWYRIVDRLVGARYPQALRDRNAGYLAAANGYGAIADNPKTLEVVEGVLYPSQILWYDPDKFVHPVVEPEQPGDDLDAMGRPPAGKVLLGVERPGGGWTGWISEAGKAPHIWHEYSDGTNFTSRLNACPRGAIPLINFKPTGGMGTAAYQAVLNGQANAVIDQAANAVKAYGRLVFVAPMHEPENDEDGTPVSEDRTYAAAWRYVVERMKAIAPNAVFVWNVMGFEGHGSRYPDLYPGDDVVDWIAWDPYVRTTASIDTWTEFLNLGAAGSWTGFYRWATAAHPGKPLMLAEWGLGSAVVPTVPTSLFGNTQMAALVRDFPALKALVYWNENGTVDYRVTHPNWPNGLLSTWVNRPEFQVDISETAKA